MTTMTTGIFHDSSLANTAPQCQHARSLLGVIILHVVQMRRGADGLRPQWGQCAGVACGFPQ